MFVRLVISNVFIFQFYFILKVQVFGKWIGEINMGWVLYKEFILSYNFKQVLFIVMVDEFEVVVFNEEKKKRKWCGLCLIGISKQCRIVNV